MDENCNRNSFSDETGQSQTVDKQNKLKDQTKALYELPNQVNKREITANYRLGLSQRM